MIEVKYILTVGMVNEGTHTHQTVTTGPRNLLKVANELAAVTGRLKDAYGNVGCGRVWVEVDGHELCDNDLVALNIQLYELELGRWKQDGGYGPRPASPTEQAKSLLAKLVAQ
ncbi:MAG: hypothetical protein M0R28_05860 [Pigmentiphaga sp.]|nr:hypothetical protein [Pigmentiphaga sp.]